jgi:PBSX family phage terminase large subunit
MKEIRWTEKQQEALAILREPAHKNVLLFGGARSGKTYLLVSSIIYRAMKYPGSRHLIARLRFAHAKLSVWLDTLQSALRDQAPPTAYKTNESDHYLRFVNGSEVWVDGLDDKDRVDKILGREYATIYFNEVSQLPYDTITTVLTRLSQHIEGCRAMAYYDCNPGGRTHWAYQIFIQGQLPTGEPAGDGFAYLRLNPQDNKDNLAEGFIENILEKLPEHKRQRFLHGEWMDPEGTVFQNWEVVEEVPEEARLHSRRTYGLDFGFSVDPAVIVDIYVNGDDVWLDELLYEPGLTNQDLGARMRDLLEPGPPIFADSAEPKSIEELYRQGFNVDAAPKGPDSVRAGIDWLLSKRLHLTQKSVNIQAEFQNYSWRTDKTGRMTPEPVDDWNHAIDAIRYGCSESIGAYRARIAMYGAGELGL